MLFVERNKTETVLEDLLPPQISREMRLREGKVALRTSKATVAFVKIGILNEDGTKCTDARELIKSLHMTVCALDKYVVTRLFYGNHLLVLGLLREM